jgi:prepilin-type N-terminal cleavage/methylation domain-containing protein
LHAALGNRASNAFTLIEMLLVIGMLGLLMAVAFSGIGQARTQARVAKANAEMRELINAWLSYEAAYDDWPTDVKGDEVEADRGVLKELLGENPDKTVYLNVQLSNNKFLDPWGSPYRLRLLQQQESEKDQTEEFVAAITFPNRHRIVRWK